MKSRRFEYQLAGVKKLKRSVTTNALEYGGFFW